MIPVAEDEMLFEDQDGQHLKWLNELPSETDLESMRGALKKGEFKLRKDPATKKQNRLEFEKFWGSASRKFNREPNGGERGIRTPGTVLPRTIV